jgi:hypothetical protein
MSIIFHTANPNIMARNTHVDFSNIHPMPPPLLPKYIIITHQNLLIQKCNGHHGETAPNLDATSYYFVPSHE